MPLRKNKKNKAEETEKLDVVKAEEKKEKGMVEEAIASETEGKKEIPYYVIEKVYNPSDKNTPMEVPPGYIYFKDALAQQRLDVLESRLAQMAAFFLGIDLNKKEEESTEEKTEG